MREFTEEEIAVAAKNFSDGNKLGKGEFAEVHLGYMKGTKVAVKRFTEVCVHNSHVSVYRMFVYSMPSSARWTSHTNLQ